MLRYKQKGFDKEWWHYCPKPPSYLCELLEGRSQHSEIDFQASEIKEELVVSNFGVTIYIVRRWIQIFTTFQSDHYPAP